MNSEEFRKLQFFEKRVRKWAEIQMWSVSQKGVRVVLIVQGSGCVSTVNPPPHPPIARQFTSDLSSNL
jgi:hypothetical protein